jgi:catechol 2,3-dioxygenase-like lactoylglutathione lyase family enzyme
MASTFTCKQDGVVIRGATDDELVANVDRHARENHPELVGKLSRADILAMATETMLANRVHTALPATDLDRARRFYAEKLGLTPTLERADGLMYDAGNGSAFLLFPTSISTRGGHTQAGIEVPDVESTVAELKARGVAFEEYDTPSVKSVNGVVTEPDGSKAAWFKDSEGNLIALVQFS